MLTFLALLLLPFSGAPRVVGASQGAPSLLHGKEGAPPVPISVMLWGFFTMQRTSLWLCSACSPLRS